jgi:hypothetical protein
VRIAAIEFFDAAASEPPRITYPGMTSLAAQWQLNGFHSAVLHIRGNQ